MVGNYEKSVFPIFMETLTRRNYWHIRYTRVNLFDDSALAGLCYNSKGRCFVELHYLIARDCSLRAFSHTCVHDAGLGSQVFPVKPDFTRSETTQGNVESLSQRCHYPSSTFLTSHKRLRQFPLTEWVFTVLLVQVLD